LRDLAMHGIDNTSTEGESDMGKRIFDRVTGGDVSRGQFPPPFHRRDSRGGVRGRMTGGSGSGGGSLDEVIRMCLCLIMFRHHEQFGVTCNGC
jgi:hypothetical protein